MQEMRRATRHTSRASVACSRCKKAKRRCDIAQYGDSCTSCRLRDEVCDFRPRGQDKRSKRQRHGNSELRARIEYLENELRNLSAQQALNERTSGSSGGPNAGLQHATDTATTSSEPEEGNLEHAPPSSSSTHPPRYRSTSSKLFPIGMDEITPQIDSSGNQQYLGASSMFPYGDQSPPLRHAGIADHLAKRAQLSPSALEDFTEPEPIVEHLLDLFWTYQASHVLVVDRHIFLRHRRLARESDGIGDRKFYTPCLLYSILALASLISTDKGVRRYSTPPEGIAGDWFNQRARILFEAEMEVPTVTTVQAAILIGSRYGTFVDSSLGWTFSGIAFRMATKLGLQLDCSRVVAMGEMSEEEAQNRSVTFWGSYVEDRLFSAYRQRPMMLMDWDITIARPRAQAQANPHMSPNYLPFTVLLNRLCGETLLGLYGQRHYNSQNGGLNKIASNIHRQLCEWQQNLPTDLSWPAIGSMAPTAPSVLVLHMHFYYNLILLHRPFLEFSKVLREISQGPNALTTSTTTCAIAAANIVRLVHDYREHYNIRQISPNAVHITFIAATIHLINFRLTNTDSHDHLLHGCVIALSELQDSYPMARRALEILHTLIDRFGPLDSGQPGQDASIANQNPQSEKCSRGTPSPTVTNNQQTDSLLPSYPWALDSLLDDWSEPLEVPSLMDFDCLPGTSGAMEETIQDYERFAPNAQSSGSAPIAGFNDPGFPLLGMDLDISGVLEMENRDLFDVFYGRTYGLG